MLKVRDYALLLSRCGTNFKNCSYTKQLIKTESGTFCCARFVFWSLFFVPGLHSLTIYNVHISFVSLISNSVYTIQTPEPAHTFLQPFGKSLLWLIKTDWKNNSPFFLSRLEPPDKQTTSLNSDTTLSCCCLKYLKFT